MLIFRGKEPCFCGKKCLRSLKEWQTGPTIGRGGGGTQFSSNTSRVEDPSTFQGRGVVNIQEVLKRCPVGKEPRDRDCGGAPESWVRRLRSRFPLLSPLWGRREKQEDIFQLWDLLQNILPTIAFVGSSSDEQKGHLTEVRKFVSYSSISLSTF